MNRPDVKFQTHRRPQKATGRVGSGSGGRRSALISTEIQRSNTEVWFLKNKINRSTNPKNRSTKSEGRRRRGRDRRWRCIDRWRAGSAKGKPRRRAEIVRLGGESERMILETTGITASLFCLEIQIPSFCFIKASF